MAVTPEILMLKELRFSTPGGMTMGDYGTLISVKTVDGHVYLSARYRPASLSFSNVEVPFSVLEDLSEIARAGGAVGSPVWVPPHSDLATCDVMGKREYDLYWEDGTQTGPGAALNQLWDYIYGLLLNKDADEPSESEPQAPDPTLWTCTCGGSENKGRFCVECGSKKPA